MVLAAVATAVTFGFFIRTINSVEQVSEQEFSGHFAFIVDENDNEFWSQVYESARTTAEVDGIYLEDMKQSLRGDYSSEDLMRVAINSDVDGIIYAGRSTEEASKLIDKAVEKGIGVTILHNDIDTSSRQCFVGINNYELGQIYATQLLDMIEPENIIEKKIMVLVGKGMSEGASNLVCLGIEDSLLGIVDEEMIPDIEVYRINDEDTFSVEEDIRNLFLSAENLPDVLFCLESSYTQCVNQAVVDYNHVGEVQIVGYFANKDILEAVDKDIIYSTISVDTQEMGKSAVEAIEEYKQIGYTNSFMPVTMEVIDKKEASKRLVQINSQEAEQSK